MGKNNGHARFIHISSFGNMNGLLKALKYSPGWPWHFLPLFFLSTRTNEWHVASTENVSMSSRRTDMTRAITIASDLKINHITRHNVAPLSVQDITSEPAGIS